MPESEQTKQQADEEGVAATESRRDYSQHRRVNWAVIVPLVTALIGAGFGFYQTTKVQQYQAQTTLIVEAIKTGVNNPQIAIKNLLFLADAGLLDDRVAKAVRQGKFAVLPSSAGVATTSREYWGYPLDKDLNHLHPAARNAVSAVLTKLKTLKNPISLYEGFRDPNYQQSLYIFGVALHDPAFTSTQAWESVRQYGLGVTFGIFRNGSWKWNYESEDRAYWNQLSEICAENGLEPIATDPAAYKVKGVKPQELRLGNYPPGGDKLWADHLRVVIAAWEGDPPAPPPPQADTGP
jgi:hypothetical protein